MPFDLGTVGAPFRMQPGLRRVDAGELQLTPHAPGSPTFGAKLAVLRNDPARALLAVPGFDAGPALAALADHAAHEHPQAFEFVDRRHARATLLGVSIEDGRLRGNVEGDVGACLQALPPPWRLPGLLGLAFAEDFAVLDAASGCIPWLAVCLPSHWAPEDKVGRHFSEVHAPVADNALLLSAAASLMTLVTGAQRWQRDVWTITPAAALDAHPQRVAGVPWRIDLDADRLAAASFLRTERQTFIPVPGQRQAVFTIRVETTPLPQAVTSTRDAAALHAALASMSPAVLAYRRLTSVREPLLAWLERRAARAG